MPATTYTCLVKGDGWMERQCFPHFLCGPTGAWAPASEACRGLHPPHKQGVAKAYPDTQCHIYNNINNVTYI